MATEAMPRARNLDAIFVHAGVTRPLEAWLNALTAGRPGLRCRPQAVLHQEGPLGADEVTGK
jgi:hypothetical protein